MPFIGNTTNYPVVDPAAADRLPLIQGGTLKQAAPGKIAALGGHPALRYTFDTDTTNSDPGPGVLRFNGAVTEVYIDDETDDSVSMVDFFDAIAAGYLLAVQEDDPTRWILLHFTAVADSTGYRTISVEAQAEGVAFADGVKVLVLFMPAGDVVGPASSTNNHFAQFDGVTGKLLKGGIALDTDGTLSANSATRVPAQSAVKTYVDALLAGADALLFKGVIDCSTNPNYPAADAGHIYIVSVAGLIGGGSGEIVEAGDMLLCRVDGSPAGTEAAVGANWNVIQTNLVAGGGQVSIQFKDEGSNLGSSGAVTALDFVGAGVTASFSGGTVTVTISGGGAGSAQDAQVQSWMGY
jgi:hypothetical protein